MELGISVGTCNAALHYGQGHLFSDEIRTHLVFVTIAERSANLYSLRTLTYDPYLQGTAICIHLMSICR